VSSDNGIYILKTPCTIGFEYRVAHCQAIDNLTFENPKGNPKVVKDYFGMCLALYNEEEAREFAEIIAKDYCYLEYGISLIELPRSFSDYLVEANERGNG